MCNTMKYISVTLFSVCLSLVGCNNSNSQENAPTPTPQPTAKPVTDSGNGLNDGDPTTPSNVLTVAGVTLQVNVRGTLAPNVALDVAIVQTSGNPAAAIRIWVGDESGVGSTKTKVHSHGNSYHAHVQAPATLPANCALWVEVQTADGQRESGSIPLY